MDEHGGFIRFFRTSVHLGSILQHNDIKFRHFAQSDLKPASGTCLSVPPNELLLLRCQDADGYYKAIQKTQKVSGYYFRNHCEDLKTTPSA